MLRACTPVAKSPAEELVRQKCYRSLDEHYNARTDLCTDIAELFVDFEAGDISRNEAWRRMRDHLVDHEFLNEEDDDA